MSNRLSKGKSISGKFQQDTPGAIVLSGIAFSVAGTTAVTTAFQFPLGAVVRGAAVKITSVSSSTNTISIGLTTGATSAGVGTGYINALAIPPPGTWLP